MDMHYLRVEVVSDAVDRRVIKRKSDGQEVEIRKQEAYVYTGHAHPDRFDLSVPRDSDGKFMAPYKPGWYTLALSSYRVNTQFRNLELDPYEIKLIFLSATDPALSAKPAKAV